MDADLVRHDRRSVRQFAGLWRLHAAIGLRLVCRQHLVPKRRQRRSDGWQLLGLGLAVVALRVGRVQQLDRLRRLHGPKQLRLVRCQLDVPDGDDLGPERGRLHRLGLELVVVHADHGSVRQLDDLRHLRGPKRLRLVRVLCVVPVGYLDRPERGELLGLGLVDRRLHRGPVHQLDRLRRVRRAQRLRLVRVLLVVSVGHVDRPERGELLGLGLVDQRLHGGHVRQLDGLQRVYGPGQLRLVRVHVDVPDGHLGRAEHGELRGLELVELSFGPLQHVRGLRRVRRPQRLRLVRG